MVNCTTTVRTKMMRIGEKVGIVGEEYSDEYEDDHLDWGEACGWKGWFS